MTDGGDGPSWLVPWLMVAVSKDSWAAKDQTPLIGVSYPRDVFVRPFKRIITPFVTLVGAHLGDKFGVFRTFFWEGECCVGDRTYASAKTSRFRVKKKATPPKKLKILKFIEETSKDHKKSTKKH